jgi:hypothetical protein
VLLLLDWAGLCTVAIGLNRSMCLCHLIGHINVWLLYFDFILSVYVRYGYFIASKKGGGVFDQITDRFDYCDHKPSSLADHCSTRSAMIKAVVIL